MMSDLYIRLRSLFRRTNVDEEVRDELRFHLERQTEKYLRAGMDPEQAMRQARMEFGGLTQAQEGCREARGVTFLETLIQVPTWPQNSRETRYPRRDTARGIVSARENGSLSCRWHSQWWF